jgi:hypothetical protein
VVLKLVASYRWNCGLNKLSTILEIKTLHICRAEFSVYVVIFSQIRISFFVLFFLFIYGSNANLFFLMGISRLSILLFSVSEVAPT